VQKHATAALVSDRFGCCHNRAMCMHHCDQAEECRFVQAHSGLYACIWHVYRLHVHLACVNAVKWPHAASDLR
jgi:hypothetical protein